MADIIKNLTGLLVLLTLTLTKPVWADWLSLCGEKPHASLIKFEELYHQADGESYWLLVLDKPDKRCESKQLDVDIDEISWVGLISHEKSARIDTRVILQGVDSHKMLRVSEVIADKAEKSSELSNTITVAQNLVDDFSIRPFGIEQRAQYSVENHLLKMSCSSGQKPAGILFDVNDKKLSSSHRLELSISYSSHKHFQLGIADDDRFNKGDPVIFSLPDDKDTLTLGIPYSKLDMSQNIHWSLVCPEDDAVISISKFELLHAGNRELDSNHDMWIWRTESWRHRRDKLFALLNKYHAKRVFISVEMDESKGKILHAEELRAFVTEAEHRDIAVWVVEGDPHATLPRGQAQFVTRAGILQQYNLDNAEHGRLAGVQYDIEPYLVRGWDLMQEQWFVAYIETLREIKRELTLPIEIAIPFWWQFKSINEQPLLDAVAPYIDSVNVMNYRTDVELIKKFAQPFLEWGLEANKKVSIALEAGPIADEQRWHFRKQETGNLWHLKAFPQPALIVLNTEKTSGIADTFSLYHQDVLAGDVVSFQKDPARLIGLLPQLESLWSQWPSFASVSLHGFESEIY